MQNYEHRWATDEGIIMNLELANFPPHYHYQRPLWAYEILGWPLLREQLFGKTWLLIEKLEEWGDIPISREDLAGLLDATQVAMPVRCRISAAHKNLMTALELVDWYRNWEETIFEAYLARERRSEDGRLGK